MKKINQKYISIDSNGFNNILHPTDNSLNKIFNRIDNHTHDDLKNIYYDETRHLWLWHSYIRHLTFTLSRINRFYIIDNKYTAYYIPYESVITDLYMYVKKPRKHNVYIYIDGYKVEGYGLPDNTTTVHYNNLNVKLKAGAYVQLYAQGKWGTPVNEMIELVIRRIVDGNTTGQNALPLW